MRYLAWIPQGFERQSYRDSRPWLIAALLLAASASVRAIAEGFFGPYETVPDDARQFIFWMQRFIDADLFSNDFIADYFQSVSPVGYVAVYKAFAWLGIEPLTTAKLLVVPVTFALAYFAFRLAHRILPIPAVAFFATWLCVFAGWFSNSTLGSGTPRAFYPPLLTAFAYFLVSRSRFGVVTCVGLLGVFYPQMAIFATGVVCLDALDWTSHGPRLRREAIATMAVTLLVLVATVLPFANRSQAFGPTVTRAEARNEATFQYGEQPHRGRTPVFQPGASWWRQHVIDGRLGFMPGDWRQPFQRKRWPALDRAWEAGMLGVVFGLPVLLIRRSRRAGPTSPAPGVRIFGDIVAAATILYIVALVTLFRLHLPSRYSTNPLNLFLPIALVLALAPMITAAARRIAPVARGGTGPFRVAVLFFVIVGAIASIGAGHVRGLEVVRAGDLHARLSATPKDTRVGMLSLGAGTIPVLGRRSILVSNEHLIPYNRGYFLEMKKRLTLLARAVHGLDADAIRTLVAEYGVDLLVIRKSEIGHPDRDWWVGVIPEVSESLAQNSTPERMQQAWAPLFDRCAQGHSGRYWIIDLRCVQERVTQVVAAPAPAS